MIKMQPKIQRYTYINKLCENLNKYLPHRLFFNLVMNKVLINRAKKKEQSRFRSLGAQPNKVWPHGDRYASGQMRTDADRTYVEAAAAQRRGSMSRSNTAMSRNNSVAPFQPQFISSSSGSIVSS